ncbi:hypothetical protein CAL12_20560 [Bordetella genomosp. 8]|uniref:HTH tetR-type domain-containing protein n=1 Tax=Bordetella genomosp. 8 TaxID=1416806 RepID=A0A1W6YPN1_9BORD|nr:TetR/AcrR family transcriptional regulator [Bordetella genomosp. 8]ARP82971.1 hypothetical protein CAL12_20560 [Bordetella genomosp. 8]
MKKSRAEVAETRNRIVDSASRLFKSQGIESTGISEIMAAAGLTPGGFYRHFPSKEALVAVACASSMEVLVESAETASEGGAESFLRHLEDFLSAEYRDDTLGGCPLVAMGSELVRSNPDTRKAASDGFQKLTDIIAKWMPVGDASKAKDAAIFTLISMIGAVTMSRVVDDPELSNRILLVTKERLGSGATPIEKVERRSDEGPAIESNPWISLVMEGS